MKTFWIILLNIYEVWIRHPDSKAYKQIKMVSDTKMYSLTEDINVNERFGVD